MEPQLQWTLSEMNPIVWWQRIILPIVLSTTWNQGNLLYGLKQLRWQNLFSYLWCVRYWYLLKGLGKECVNTHKFENLEWAHYTLPAFKVFLSSYCCTKKPYGGFCVSLMSSCLFIDLAERAHFHSAALHLFEPPRLVSVGLCLEWSFCSARVRNFTHVKGKDAKYC